VTGACRTSSTIALSVPTCCLDVCVPVFSASVSDDDLSTWKTSRLSRTVRRAVWMSASEVFSSTVKVLNIELIDKED